MAEEEAATEMLALVKCCGNSTGYKQVSLYLQATDKAALYKKRFSVTAQRGGEPVVAGRFATAEEAALRRHIALKALGA